MNLRVMMIGLSILCGLQERAFAQQSPDDTPPELGGLPSRAVYQALDLSKSDSRYTEIFSRTPPSRIKIGLGVSVGLLTGMVAIGAAVMLARVWQLNLLQHATAFAAMGTIFGGTSYFSFQNSIRALQERRKLKKDRRAFVNELAEMNFPDPERAKTIKGSIDHQGVFQRIQTVVNELLINP